MNAWSKIIKVMLALTATALVLSARAAFAADGGAASPPKAQRVEITITEKGYEPQEVKVKKGEPVELVLTRKTDRTCATEIVLKEHNINTKLPLNQPVTVTFTPDKSGKLKYGCAMGMMLSGVIKVD